MNKFLIKCLREANAAGKECIIVHTSDCEFNSCSPLIDFDDVPQPRFYGYINSDNTYMTIEYESKHNYPYEQKLYTGSLLDTLLNERVTLFLVDRSYSATTYSFLWGDLAKTYLTCNGKTIDKFLLYYFTIHKDRFKVFDLVDKEERQAKHDTLKERLYNKQNPSYILNGSGHAEVIEPPTSFMELDAGDELFTLIEDDYDLDQVVTAIASVDDIGLDTETTGLNPRTDKLRLLQLNIGGSIYIIDCFKVQVSQLKEHLYAKQIIGHNIKFDLGFLHYAGIAYKGFVRLFDTFIASKVLSQGESLKHSLKDVSERYLKLTLDKEQQKSNWGGGLSKEQLHYAALDVQHLPRLKSALYKKIIELNLSKIFELESQTLLVATEMDLAGIGFDAEAWKVQALESRSKLTTLEKELAQELAYEEFHDGMLFPVMQAVNLSSPAQVLKALSKKGIHLTSTDSIELCKHKEPIIEKILEYRKLEKKVKTYGEEMLNYVYQGRIYGNFNQLQAKTGRFSSSNPNLQNIPREVQYRKCFVATPGYKLIQADYGQMELRAAASVFKEPVLIEAFETGADIHKLTAANIYQKPIEEVTKAERSLAKKANFGLLYGIGADKFRDNCIKDGIAITPEEADKVVKGFFDLYKGFAKVKYQSRKDADKHSEGMELRTAFGRRCWLSGSYIGNQILNVPIQGVCADITKLALVAIYNQLPPAAKIIAMIHDEVLVEAKEGDAESVARLVEREMTKAFKLLLPDVICEVEANIIDNWGSK